MNTEPWCFSMVTAADGNKIIALSANGATDGALFTVSETGTRTLRSVTIASGAIASPAAVEGTSVTDGTATLSSGALSGVTTIASAAITSSALITGVWVTSTGVVVTVTPAAIGTLALRQYTRSCDCRFGNSGRR